MKDHNSVKLQKGEGLTPSAPEDVKDTGLDFGFLADLTLKTAYIDTECTTERVAEKLKLPKIIAETLLQYLYREKLVEILPQVDVGNKRYAMLNLGWERVQRLLDVSGYIGPAPVSLNAYTSMFQMHRIYEKAVKPEVVRAALADFVLSENTIQTLGLVASSRRSLFLSGPAGNGKTAISQALHSSKKGDIWIPYAIEVDGQVIKVFDIHNHEPVPPPASVSYDQRWVKIKRPLVIVGGELTIETMDLIYNKDVRYYEAPFQMKSNGGTLIIDDFGRQRVDPHDLLNRWIIPLENHIDYLTLHTGKKIRIPFEQMLIFATNLDPASLVDDAFLRRMGYRLRVEPPKPEIYTLIFQRYADSRDLSYDAKLIDMLLKRYENEQRQMSGCDPRNLIDRCLDLARYNNREASLSPAILEIAWSNYFGIENF
jgi:hypothetical protein